MESHIFDYGLLLASTFGSTIGAESFPYGLYCFVHDPEGQPALINAQYIYSDGPTGLTIKPDLYNSPGQPQHGKPRPVFLVVRHHETGIEYRLSASALQRAFEAIKGKHRFGPVFTECMELQQIVTEDANGYQVAKVTFS